MGVVARAAAVQNRWPVVGTLVVRDLRIRYAGSVLGYVWTVLDPLAMAMVYWFVFAVVFKARDVGQEPYILFLVVGLLAWQWFSQCVTDSSKAIVSERRLVRSTNLPREVWVLRVVLSKGVEYLFSLPVILIFCVAYLGTVQLNWRLVFFPLAILMQTVLLVGIGLLLAPVTALVRDTQRVVRIGLRMMFYLTPVVYAVHSIPKSVKPLLELNPMTGILELYRAGFFDVTASWRPVAASAVVTLTLFVVGWFTFIRLESAVLKEI